MPTETTPRLGLLVEFGGEAPFREQLDRWADLGAVAQRSGFSSIWIPEGFPPGAPSGNPPSALIVAAALANRTSLDLGTGVVLLPAANPLRLAYESALVDQIANGRLHLGIGMGDSVLVRRFGADAANLGALADETLASLRALWSGARGFQGELLRIEGGIHPLPARPGGPPIWVGGYARRTLDRAVRFGDAYYFGSASTLPTVRAITERYRRALEKAGRAPQSARVAVNRFAVVADTDAAARALAQGPVGEYLQRYAAAGNVRDGSAPRSMTRDEAFDELEATMAIIGSPKTVARRVGEYAQVGVTDIHLRVRTGTTPFDVAARTIELVGRSVQDR
jgi:alkanesulfonate monooxygenase SsuD/methylene tetrahydromethanopterin reductase-like flavin-dependent oxidoreductase (luciferase family)